MTSTSPPLLGLIGQKRAGKDAVAAVLVEEFGWRRVAFADPLRAAALGADPLVGPCSLPGDLVPAYHYLADVVEALGWEVAKDTVPGVRRFLQRLGTEGIRALDDGFWVRAAMQTVEHLRTRPRRPEEAAPVVVTDCRFPNEAEAILEAGGELLRIIRPGSAPADSHPSETTLVGYPTRYVLHNGGTLDDLRTSVRALPQLV
jgi:hypothetical protein